MTVDRSTDRVDVRHGRWKREAKLTASQGRRPSATSLPVAMPGL